MFGLTVQEKQQLNKKYGLFPENTQDNRLLSQAMRILRSHRVVLPPQDKFGLFRLDDYVQLWIQTETCRHSKYGSCTICNYWNGRRCADIVDELIAWDLLPTDGHTLLLNTCGSCLDPLELCREEQDKLFAWISRYSYKRIILETHADTLNQETVERVCQRFQNQEIFFEFGIESTSSDVLFYCLNRKAPQRSVLAIAETIHHCGALCIANVLLGSPFLSGQEQVEDAVRTIQELRQQEVDYIVLFPVNIKAHTLPYFLHQHHQYEVVSGDMIVNVLAQFSADELPRIDVAWYGEHREEDTIPPRFCPKCQVKLPELLRAYNHVETPLERKNILKKMQKLRCTCPRENMGAGQEDFLYGRLDRGYELIRETVFSEGKVN